MSAIEDRIQRLLSTPGVPFYLSRLLMVYYWRSQHGWDSQALETEFLRQLDWFDPSSTANMIRSLYHLRSETHVAQQIFSNIISGQVWIRDYPDLMFHPLARDYNREFIDIGRDKGLGMCHGHKHAAPIIPDFIPMTVRWELADINPSTEPDRIVNMNHLDQIRQLGYYQYSISHYCPINFLDSLCAYIYCLRQIQVPGGLIMLHGLPGISELEKMNFPMESILNIYVEYVSLVLNYCGCASMQWYSKLSHAMVDLTPIFRLADAEDYMVVITI